MKKKDLEEIYELVENACKSKDNYFGYNAWLYHIKSVVKNSKLLAKRLNADEEVVEIAALFHDFACIKRKSWYDEHHIHSARIAEEILLKYGYPKDRIELVKYCISVHRGSRKDIRKTVEAEILASADAMSHFENLHSLLYLAFSVHKMDETEGVKWVLGKLKRSWEKLIPEAREMVKDYYKAIKLVLGG